KSELAGHEVAFLGRRVVRRERRGPTQRQPHRGTNQQAYDFHFRLHDRGGSLGLRREAGGAKAGAGNQATVATVSSAARIPIPNMTGSHAGGPARMASTGSPDAVAALSAHSCTLVLVRAAATKANCHGSSSAM